MYERTAGSTAQPVEPETCEATLAVGGERGLDLMAAARLAQIADHLPATVLVRCGRTQADARSIFGLLALQARPGTRLTLIARGPRAAEAVARMRASVEGARR